MRYAQATKVALFFRKRFWEQEGIYGGHSLVTGPAGQLFYGVPPRAPSSKAQAPGDGIVASLRYANLPVNLPHSLGAESASAVKGVAAEGTDVGGGGAIVRYVWGSDAHRLESLAADERAEVVLAALRQLHGGVVDELITGAQSIGWGSHRWSMGAYAQPLPGELSQHFNVARRAEGELYFSGEHLSGDPGWIEGSVSSTLDALIDMFR